MKTSIRATLVAFVLLTYIISFGFITNGYSQDRRSRNEKVVKVKRIDRHRHLKTTYRPHWAKKITYSRRWVYFPKYNFYWDNVRNKYIYLHKGAWVVHKKQPVFLVNVNLEAEKSVELTEDEDFIENIQENNAKHIELKTE